MERRAYALRLWYDGGAFRGFQRQPGMPTVQEALEGALQRALPRPVGTAAGPRRPRRDGGPPALAVAARTDAGVHALGQVVSFSVRAALAPEALRRDLNAALPEGIAVLDAWAAPSGFHARGTATARTYVYLVGCEVPLGLQPYAWTLPDARAFPDLASPAIDPGALRAALAPAVGEHDFAGFARPGEQRGTVRTLLRAEVISATWGPLHAIVLTGKGFLRAMVRNLVGTAVTAALGLAPPDHLRALLRARDRYRGVRAPGWGLTLAGVSYPPEVGPRWPTL